jgi:hypothetical protein
MSNPTYAELYRDSRWQEKRLRIMDRDEFCCRSCEAGGPGVTLNVHHAYYEKGKAPWEYPDETLTTLCERCHKEIHLCMKRIAVQIKDRIAAAYIVAGYAHGLKDDKCEEVDGEESSAMFREGFGSGYGDRTRMLRMGIVEAPERPGEQ